MKKKLNIQSNIIPIYFLFFFVSLSFSFNLLFISPIESKFHPRSIIIIMIIIIILIFICQLIFTKNKTKNSSIEKQNEKCFSLIFLSRFLLYVLANYLYVMNVLLQSIIFFHIPKIPKKIQCFFFNFLLFHFCVIPIIIIVNLGKSPFIFIANWQYNIRFNRKFDK